MRLGDALEGVAAQGAGAGELGDADEGLRQEDVYAQGAGQGFDAADFVHGSADDREVEPRKGASPGTASVCGHHNEGGLHQ